MSARAGAVEIVYRSSDPDIPDEVEWVEIPRLYHPHVIERNGRRYSLLHWEVGSHSGRTSSARLVYTDDPAIMRRRGAA